MRRTKACEYCGASYSRNPQYSDRQWVEQKYCGRDCFGLATRKDMETRFRAFFRPAAESSCWVWTGSKDEAGYGLFQRATRHLVRAHRLSFELHNGITPGELRVLHRCDNPPCVNPHHLFLGTDLDNARDMIAKGRGRHLRGEELPAAKLSEDQVRQIRADPRTQAVIAAEYGLGQTGVSAIKRRATWGWLA